MNLIRLWLMQSAQPNRSDNKEYTTDFKLDAIGWVLEHGFTIAEAAGSLGIKANMLRRWIKENLSDSAKTTRIL